jgi:RHS repeat-associated protein
MPLDRMNVQTTRGQGISQQYTEGTNTIEKVWAGACEYITKNGQLYKHTYLSGPMGVFAIHIIKPNGTEEINYIHTDHLGSWNTITDKDGNLLQELSFDAWGNRRNPATWRAFTGTPPAPLFDRGFTGHEHLYAFNLINMNGRVYDPIVGRMLSPDNFMQAPDYSQNFNRYSYCLNNPLVYTDPSGEFVWIVAAAYFVFFTDPGYQLQKYVSPVAFKVDIKLGTHQRGIGYDASVGIPKALPYAKRWERGDTYYWKNFGNYKGWENRTGTEESYFGLYTKSTTYFKSGEFTQTVGRKSFGIPSFLGVDVSNDLFGDEGDRFRTSHVRISFGPLRIGNTLFTGDPGLNDRNVSEINGYPTYVKGPYGEDPDKYRNGILYLGLGSVEIGWDSEAIRNRIQNYWVHQNTNPPSPFFRDLRGTDQYAGDKFYFQFGWGGLW